MAAGHLALFVALLGHLVARLEAAVDGELAINQLLKGGAS